MYRPKCRRASLRDHSVNRVLRAPSFSGREDRQCRQNLRHGIPEKEVALALQHQFSFAPDEKDLVTPSDVASYAVYSLEPSWYLRRACRMLRASDRPQTVALCASLGQ
jgi:hypothetical protein